MSGAEVKGVSRKLTPCSCASNCLVASGRKTEGFCRAAPADRISAEVVALQAELDKLRHPPMLPTGRLYAVYEADLREMKPGDRFPTIEDDWCVVTLANPWDRADLFPTVGESFAFFAWYRMRFSGRGYERAGLTVWGDPKGL
jgi:hypothetical protein